jgi:tetratricopeptide (TPR) repeat protein
LAERIAIRRLDEDGTTQLLASALDRVDISPEFSDLLYQRTEGNPFFLQQVLRVLMERGDLFQGDGGWTRKAIAEIEVPESIRSVVGHRLSRLPEGTQEILHEASVLGQAFLFDDLLAMAGRSEKDIEGAVETATRAGLLREKAPDAYSFDHALTQQSLYLELTARRRRKLHLAAGEAIESLPKTRREKRVDELAWHFVQADDTRRALPYSLQAGEAAQEVYANGDAELHFRTAAELAGELNDERLEAEALEKLAEILFTSARYAEQFETADRAAQLCRTLGDLEGEGRVVARLGWGHFMSETIPEGIPRVREMIARFNAREATPALFALYEAMATLASGANHPSEALMAAGRSLELAQALGEERLVARAQGRRGMVLSTLGRDGDALDALEVAIPLADRAGDLDTLSRALNNAAHVHLRRGDGDRFEEFQRRNLELARRAGNPAITLHALYRLRWQLFERGNWSESWALVDEGLRIFRQTLVESPRTILALHGCRPLVEGDIEGARACFDECIAESGRSRDTDLRALAVLLQAQTDWLVGRPEAGAARLEAELNSGAIFDHEVLSMLRLLLGRLWLETASSDGTERARAQLSVMAEEGIMTPWGVFDSDPRPLQAWLAARQGDLPGARRIMQETAAFYRKLGYVWSEAHTVHVWGRIEMELQNLDEARSHFEDALSIYRRLDAVPYVEEAERQLARLGQF